MTIFRLYDFTENTTIQSSQVDNELNQLISEVNLKLATAGGTITGNLGSTGSFVGTREYLPLLYGRTMPYGGSDRYPDLIGQTDSTTNEQGVALLHSGSVTGMTIMLNCTSYTSNCVFTPTIRKDGSNLFTTAGLTVNATGVQTQSNTYARGTYLFSSGSRISYFHDVTTNGTATGIFWLLLEVQYDI